MPQILPIAEAYYYDVNGNPLASGTLEYYIPNTLTAKTTWADAGQVTPHTNPITLDTVGHAVVYGNGLYREIVRDALGNLVYDRVTGLLCTGATGLLTSVDSIDFGIVCLDDSSDATTVTVTNATDSTVVVSSVTASAGFAVSNNTCGSLASAATCSFDVMFSPTVAGAATGTVSIASNAPVSPSVVSLTGEGFDCGVGANACGLLVCPALDFECVDANAASDPQTITITNADAVSRTISAIYTIGGPFVISSLPSLPYVLTAGNSLDVDVYIYAGDAGNYYAGSFVVESDSESSPDSVSLTASVCVAGQPFLVMTWGNPPPEIFVNRGSGTPEAPIVYNYVVADGSNLLGACTRVGPEDSCHWEPGYVQNNFLPTRIWYLKSADCGVDITNFTVTWDTGYIYPSVHIWNTPPTLPIDNVMMTFRQVTNDGSVLQSQRLTLRNLGDEDCVISAIASRSPVGVLDVELVTDAVLPLTVPANSVTHINVTFAAPQPGGTSTYLGFPEERYLVLTTNMPVTTTTLAANLNPSDTSMSITGTAGPRAGDLINITGIFAYYLAKRSSNPGPTTTDLHVPEGATLTGASAGATVSWGNRVAVACMSGLFFTYTTP